MVVPGLGSALVGAVRVRVASDSFGERARTLAQVGVRPAAALNMVEAEVSGVRGKHGGAWRGKLV